MAGYALRAATNLARTLALQGADEAAIAVLAPSLDVLVEGYDTADVRSAQELLTALDPPERTPAARFVSSKIVLLPSMARLILNAGL